MDAQQFDRLTQRVSVSGVTWTRRVTLGGLSGAFSSILLGADTAAKQHKARKRRKRRKRQQAAAITCIKAGSSCNDSAPCCSDGGCQNGVCSCRYGASTKNPAKCLLGDTPSQCELTMKAAGAQWAARWYWNSTGVRKGGWNFSVCDGTTGITSLQWAEFNSNYFSGSDFHGVHLEHASTGKCCFNVYTGWRGADFTNANLTGSVWRDTDTSEGNFTGAIGWDWTGAFICHTTMPNGHNACASCDADLFC